MKSPQGAPLSACHCPPVLTLFTLWFGSGSETNWNAETLTYADGENRVTVSGVGADRITLKFGNDGSEQYGDLSAMNAFEEAATKRIFEADAGALAGL